MAGLLDLFLHLDTHLAEITAAYGPWIYGLLFLIIFAETGLVVTPFLPGDSLLFACGALAATGSLDATLLVLSIGLAMRIRYLTDPHAYAIYSEQLLWRAVLFASAVVVCMFALGLYQPQTRETRLGVFLRQVVQVGGCKIKFPVVFFYTDHGHCPELAAYSLRHRQSIPLPLKNR